jgi:hypothetical protein
MGYGHTSFAGMAVFVGPSGVVLAFVTSSC